MTRDLDYEWFARQRSAAPSHQHVRVRPERGYLHHGKSTGGWTEASTAREGDSEVVTARSPRAISRTPRDCA